MKIKQFITLALLTTFLMSCGQEQKTHALVEDFMEEGMKLENFDVVVWSKLKPTYFITDSIVQVMRNKAAQSGLVGKDVNYASKTDTLNYIQVKYALEKDTIHQTFYLDDKLTGIVGVKNN